MKMDANDRKRIQQGMLSWFRDHGRDLPWRRDYAPYRVWISEIMLQQTQMERGVEYFLNWMAQFPTVADVAEASEQKILRNWQGLGYYDRARNLHKAAKQIVDQHRGNLPRSHAQLLELPGIGPYTAAAIASIAYNLDFPVVDANVERVYSRIFNIESPIKEKISVARVRQIAEELLPAGNAREYNQALMDFGALVCTPKNPQCEHCFCSDMCVAFEKNLVHLRPVTRKKEKQILVEMASGILFHRGLIYIQQRLENDVWGGLWEFPGGRLKKNEPPEKALVREFAEETEFQVEIDRKISTVTHYYTKYKVLLTCFTCILKDHCPEDLPLPVLHAAQQYRWVKPEELDNFGFSAGHTKILDYVRTSCPEILL